MPAAHGRFPQVSGLCFTYNISNAPGSRVAVGGAAGGGRELHGCPSRPDLSHDLRRSPQNDFITSGGDGYPNFFARATTREIMDQALADYIAANTPINPTIQGRINCIPGPPCPVVTP